MKKLAMLLMMAIAIVAFSACGGGASTPTKAAEKAMSYVKDNNYEGLIDMLVDKQGEPISKEDAAQLKAIVKEKKAEAKAEDGVKEFKILSEEISEDGTTANVDMEVVYGDGKTKSETMTMVKAKDGSWHPVLGK